MCMFKSETYKKALAAFVFGNLFLVIMCLRGHSYEKKLIAEYPALTSNLLTQAQYTRNVCHYDNTCHLSINL